MKNIVGAYKPIPIKNSPIEFVVVGMELSDFRPIIVSENCGLDLLGFAASRSYSSKFDITDSATSSIFSTLRSEEDSYAHQFIELAIHTNQFKDLEAQSSERVYFYWKGARLSSDAVKEVKRIAEINFSIIMNELTHLRNYNNEKNSPRVKEADRHDIDGFLSWHISPVIRVLSYFNLKRRRYRDFRKLFLLIYGAVLGFVGLAATLYFTFTSIN